MSLRARLLCGIVISYAIVLPAYAEENCDKALIVSTYSDSQSFHSDWRLAKFVTHEVYDELKKSFDANAVVYGIPMGASYDEYKQKYDKLESSLKESLTTDQSRQILWTGLSQASTDDYAKCLEKNAKDSPGLHLSVDKATDSDFTLRLKWYVAGNAAPTHVSWTQKKIGSTELQPIDLEQGEDIITVPRPEKQIGLAAKTHHYASETVVLGPLPPPYTKPDDPLHGCPNTEAHGVIKTGRGGRYDVNLISRVLSGVFKTEPGKDDVSADFHISDFSCANSVFRMAYSGTVGRKSYNCSFTGGLKESQAVGNTTCDGVARSPKVVFEFK